MKVSIIAAVAWNGVIGNRGDLPWRLPADLRHFKQTTMDHHVLMGRKTWESIGRPLPGRRILVVSASGYEPDLPADIEDGAVTVVASLKKGLALARKRGEDELIVAGGAEVYEQMMASAERLYITRVDSSFAGDAFFPWIDRDRWDLESEDYHLPNERNEFPMRFQVWERRGS